MTSLQTEALTAIEAVIAARGDALDEQTRNLMRAAAMRAARDRARAPRPLTKQDREDLLSLLAAGMTVDDAADVLDRNISTLYRHRQADKEFERRWIEALEVGCGPVERRLGSIAMTGEAGSMATVRAAEVLLKTRHRAHQQAKPQGVSATIDDGQGRSFTVRMGHPSVD